jgi:hypothetical protein
MKGFFAHCGKYATFSNAINLQNGDIIKISIEELFGQPARRNDAF